jgi:SAM-dependent methyltransferase
MCYSPRPEEVDLEAKYRFLSTRERTGALTVESPRGLRLDKRRARSIFRFISKHYDLVPPSVLDVGGGDGHLLRPFLAAGTECFVVDYNQHPIHGVTRLGATPRDLEDGRSFSAIVCSPVLEHVASPLTFLLRLRAALVQNGVLYVEVPFEIWRDIPIHLDPVTHVNFFTRDSLATILELSGFRVLGLHYRLAPYGEHYKRVTIALATPGDIRNARVRPPRALELLSPGPVARASRFVENFWLRSVLNLPLRLRR